MLTLKGLTIKNGFVTGDYKEYGGGVLAQGNIALENCVFKKNVAECAGGGVRTRGNATITSCIFNSNTTKHSEGGGVYAWGDAALTNCIFDGNKACAMGGPIRKYKKGQQQSLNRNSRLSLYHIPQRWRKW